MTIVLNGFSSIPLEVTYDDPSLFVALKVYKYNGSAWVQDGSDITALLATTNYTYMAIWTPSGNGGYLAELMAYTDNTYLTPKDGYSPSSRSFLVRTYSTPVSGTIASIVMNLQPKAQISTSIKTNHFSMSLTLKRLSMSIETEQIEEIQNG